MDENYLKIIGLLSDFECVFVLWVLYRDFCGRVYVFGTCVAGIITQQMWTTLSINETVLRNNTQRQLLQNALRNTT
jgi:hypothetical protein